MASKKPVPQDLNLKFRSKFNHYTNYTSLYYPILKVLYGFKEKQGPQGKKESTRQEKNNFSFKMFKIRLLRY